MRSRAHPASGRSALARTVMAATYLVLVYQGTVGVARRIVPGLPMRLHYAQACLYTFIQNLNAALTAL